MPSRTTQICRHRRLAPPPSFVSAHPLSLPLQNRNPTNQSSLGDLVPQKVPEMVVKEIVRLGLRADRERADPSLGMGLTLENAKALRQAAGRRVDLSPSARAGGRGGISAEEALYARVQAEVVKEDKVLLQACLLFTFHVFYHTDSPYRAYTE